MKFGKLKIDKIKLLSVGVALLGIVGTLLSGKVEADKQKAMKIELKDEIMKDLLNNK